MRSLFDKEVAEKGLLLSQICVLISLPHLYYLYFIGMKDIVLKTFKTEHLPYLMTIQIWQVFFVTLCCAICGLGWSKKFNLVGFGNLWELKRIWLKLITLGLLLGSISAAFFDTRFKSIAPYYYPANPLWALSILIDSAFFIETIRFGMMMIAFRLIRRLYLSNILTALFLTLVGLKSFSFLPIGVNNLNLISILAFLFNLVFQLILGYVFIKKGLICALFVHIIYGLKYLYFAILQGVKVS